MNHFYINKIFHLDARKVKRIRSLLVIFILVVVYFILPNVPTVRTLVLSGMSKTEHTATNRSTAIEERLKNRARALIARAHNMVPDWVPPYLLLSLCCLLLAYLVQKSCVDLRCAISHFRSNRF